MNKVFLDAYDYYMRFHYDMENGIPPGDPQHELMAAHYRDIIQDALEEFDDSFDEEIYETPAWVGLLGKVVWTKADLINYP